MSDRTPVRPLVPLALGAGGLIPFVGLAALVLAGVTGPPAWLVPSLVPWPGGVAPRAALAAYGALIAAFLGGIRWGAIVAREAARPAGSPERSVFGALDYALSVVPQLVAWAALMLPAPWDLRALGALLLVWGFVDQDLARRGLAPSWFGRLRLVLSLVAGAALLAAA